MESSDEPNNLSTISEIVPQNVTPLNESPDRKNEDMGNTTGENLGWETPDGLHCSINDLRTRNGLQNTALKNIYRLEYTASPAQEGFSESENNKTAEQSFLDQRRSEQLNL